MSEKAILTCALTGVLTDPSMGNIPVERWDNPNPVHVGSPRTILTKPIRNSNLLVKAIVPQHERKSYDESLQGSWTQFVTALGGRLEILCPNLSRELETLDLGQSDHLPIFEGVLARNTE